MKKGLNIRNGRCSSAVTHMNPTYRTLAAKLSLLFVAAAPFVVALPACAPDSGVESDEATSDSAALSLSFEVLPITKSAAPAGITVIKNKAQYVAFFGVQPTSDISFQHSWVINYSMGVENTGGYNAEISAVDRTGSGSHRKLTVSTISTSPGASCPVTQSLTNPQVTVKINKQTNPIAIVQNDDAVVTDCNAFCPHVKCANGFECDEAQDACVPRSCDETNPDCPAGFSCENHIACITAPCPTDYRCYETDPCHGITFEGTCTGNTLQYCDNATLVSLSCGSETCGYDSSNSWYDCL